MAEFPATKRKALVPASAHESTRREPEAAAGPAVLAANFAHELRTPLAVLKGRLHGLEDGVIDPATGECGRLLAQVDKLLHVVDSLGTLANVHSGEFFMDCRRVDLAAILLTVMEAVQRDMIDGRVEQRFHCDPVNVECDPARLAQALTALARAIISNLPPGAQFEVQLRAAPNEAMLLFGSTCWTQAPNAAVTPLAALTSLDAALANALLDAHGLQLAVAPRLAGKGTFVALRIPVSR